MEILGVIPARYGSTRFPGKVLADICGKPMVIRVLEGISTAKKISRVLVATESQIVKKAVEASGWEAILTSEECKSGTERVGEVAKKIKADAYINIQADEPLIKGEAIDLIASALEDGEDFVSLYTSLREEEKDDPNKVKIVLNRQDYAIYFSRVPVPYRGPFFKHVGIYGYSRDGLFKYLELPPSPLELSEDLEQLRLIFHGEKIKMIKWDGKLVSVDTMEDLKLAKEVFCAEEN
ncbi:MAG: 3-deoxy-manno-octulosonate cytidylyltransferase [Candidatus Aminicenantes bacterium]|nr:3-deoxy-manno-octulosonate cytidylyltransferase [Candidatus Aminicenantes bacterium]